MWFELDFSGRQNKSDPHFLRMYGNHGTSVPVISSSNTASFCECRRFQRKKLGPGLIPRPWASVASMGLFSPGRFSGGLSEAGPDGSGSGFESGR